MDGKVKRFGDLGFDFTSIKNWVKLEDLIDQEIMVEDALQVKGDFGDYLIVKFRDMKTNEVSAFTTGSKVVCDKILTAKDMKLLPLAGQVIKKKNWFDIV